MNYIINETKDYYSLAVLFQESGLEVKPEDGIPEGIVKMWRCDDKETGELIGGATVQVLNGIYVLKHLAVNQNFRKMGIGKELMSLAEKELVSRGAREMWLSGKVPAFYQKFGWEQVNADRAPSFSKCLECKQLNETCFPSIMRKAVK